MIGRSKNILKSRHNILLCAFDEWTITAISPMGEVVSDPPIRDYVRYVLHYLICPGPVYRPCNQRFISRLTSFFRRLFTNSLKPGQV